MGSHDGEADELPPPPPVPPNVVPIKADDVLGESPPNKPVKPKKLPMVRPGVGRKGQPIQLYSNHFKVLVKSTEDFFFHYDVCLTTKLLTYSKYIVAFPSFFLSLSLYIYISLTDQIVMFVMNR
jgi:hypothetical protein